MRITIDGPPLDDFEANSFVQNGWTLLRQLDTFKDLFFFIQVDIFFLCLISFMTDYMKILHYIAAL